MLSANEHRQPSQVEDCAEVGEEQQTGPEEASASSVAAPFDETDNGNFPSLLRLYYQRLFPYKSYVRWLSYDAVPSKAFTHREFSFTLMNDVYIRWNSFNHLDEFKSEILRLCPSKIDIGAVYTARPREKKMVVPQVFQPVEKELVFDIDLTDYDDVRTCCSGSDICRECWQFMTVAVKIVDAYLYEDFGFNSRLWVYSGRRGVHCWVADPRARSLSNDGRKAIVSFIEVIKGGASQSKKVNLPEIMHPSLSRSCRIIQPHFAQCLLRGQNILGSQAEWEKVLRLIPDDEIRIKLNKRWRESSSSSDQRWEDIVREINNATKNKSKNKSHSQIQRKAALNTCLNNIMFQYTYPRLDDKVSVQINHLLKGPFCIHPKTGKVCVPIPLDDLDSFDPMSVPTVAGLMREINEFEARATRDSAEPRVADGKKTSLEVRATRDSGEPRVADWKKTSLKPYIKYFETFVQVLVEEGIRKRAAESSSSMSF